MRRPTTTSVNFAACLNTPNQTYRLLSLPGYPAIAAPQPRITGLDRCQGLYLKGWRHQENGQFKAALRTFQELLIISRQYGHLGWISAAENALEGLAAEMVVAEVATLLNPAAAPELASTQLRETAQTLQEQGQLMPAMATYQQALQAAVQEQHPGNIGLCLTGMGLIHLDQGQYDQAQTQFQAATDILSEIHAPAQSAIAFHNLGVAYYQQGHSGEALSSFQTALNHWQQVDDTLGVALTLDYLGRAYVHNQDYWLALGSFEAALDVLNELAPTHDVRAEAADLMEQMSLLCECTRHLDLAIAYAMDALKLYPMQSAADRVVIGLHRLGQLHQQAGQGLIADYYHRQAGRVASQV